MISTGFGCSGCLTLIFGFFALIFLLKFWFIILIIGLVAYFWHKSPQTFDKVKSAFSQKEEFISKPGAIYKECKFCHRKSDRKANFCDNCGKPFEGN